MPYINFVIKSFRNKGLSELWSKDRSSRIDRRLQERVLERLDALDAAKIAEDMNVPGYDFHGLRGFKPTRYTVHINGPWCITFEFLDGDAYRVDLEQYH
jgi:proteic killer suppression protein